MKTIVVQFLQSVLFAFVIASPLIAYFWMMKPEGYQVKPILWALPGNFARFA